MANLFDDFDLDIQKVTRNTLSSGNLVEALRWSNYEPCLWTGETCDCVTKDDDRCLFTERCETRDYCLTNSCNTVCQIR